MNLEIVEQRCLNYLKQVTNPLVSIDQVLGHLRMDEACGDITERELLDFLRAHELFTVIDPVGLARDADGAGRFAEAGIATGPRIMLSTRVPARAQLAEQLDGEMRRLSESLRVALGHAEKARDVAKAADAAALIERIETLRERLQALD